MTCTRGLVISELTIRKYAENWMTHKRHYTEFRSQQYIIMRKHECRIYGNMQK